MAISRVDDQENVPSGSATSNPLPALTGVADGDLLVHLFGLLSTSATVTEPVAGLTVRGDATSGTNLGGRIRTKTAASEPASYTWGISTAVKSAAWAGAYRGLDATAPVAAASMVAGTAGTTQTTPAVTVPEGGWLVYGVITRHAPGAAGVTTWSSSAGGDPKRADAATNAGSADITMAVWDSGGPLAAASGVTRTLTSSGSEGNAVVFAIALKPDSTTPPPAASEPAPGIPIF
ncbi:hypothetical protein GA0070622_0885 [Micromonospora sediminicola]|uniref:Uncharacterized protein n=1 Tax=Micromonospora sediminicola TaxID=946078 RepID=A0A1A9B4T7_9ACTN|nr:hypothetical protein [Micromonospora sediminicola]SBT63917.1 hypothetical protein GA0070622_0885 [Micromonospora sediminicola]